jgi:hypothetical protein
MIRYNIKFSCILILFVALGMYYRKVVEGNATSRVYLVGDSIFDNGMYVPKGEDVYSYIKKKNPRAIMVARDNSTIQDVYRQLDRIHATDNDTIFISIGGNDILNNIMTMDEMMIKYREMLSHVEKGKIFLCDVYYPPQMKHLYPIIKKWNAFIHSFRGRYGIKKISNTITLPEHFTSIIEPSHIGSKIIAETICPGETCNPSAHQE